MRFAIRYCGSCNPHVDLRWIGEKLQEKARAVNAQFVSPRADDIDLLFLLCGCPTACANTPEIHDLVTEVIVVADETVDLVPTPEKDIPEALYKRLLAATRKKGKTPLISL